MVILKNKKFTLWFMTICGAILGISLISSTVGAYTCKTGDTACEAARSNMLENQNSAVENTRKADSVAKTIESISAEISNIEAEIARNEAEISELNTKITETEAELKEEQTALAEVLVNIHFDGDSEPIKTLAGASSISDLAEKQAREEVVKKEIAAASERVKNLKKELEEQKVAVQAKLEANENSRQIAASKRADQEVLRSSYEQQADDAAVLADYWKQEFERLAYTPPQNTIGSGHRNYNARDTYAPSLYANFGGVCPEDNVAFSAYGGAACQCTSYASYKAYERYGAVQTASGFIGSGHAYNYVNLSGVYVPSTGAYTHVDREPAPGTIAVKTDGPYGHVMWVEGVNGDGTINVTEYNVSWASIGCYAGDFCSRDSLGTVNTYFIHFD